MPNPPSANTSTPLPPWLVPVGAAVALALAVVAWLDPLPLGTPEAQQLLDGAVERGRRAAEGSAAPTTKSSVWADRSPGQPTGWPGLLELVLEIAAIPTPPQVSEPDTEVAVEPPDEDVSDEPVREAVTELANWRYIGFVRAGTAAPSAVIEINRTSQSFVTVGSVVKDPRWPPAMTSTVTSITPEEVRLESSTGELQRVVRYAPQVETLSASNTPGSEPPANTPQ